MPSVSTPGDDCAAIPGIRALDVGGDQIGFARGLHLECRRWDPARHQGFLDSLGAARGEIEVVQLVTGGIGVADDLHHVRIALAVKSGRLICHRVGLPVEARAVCLEIEVECLDRGRRRSTRALRRGR
jgi:hypothetical protein